MRELKFRGICLASGNMVFGGGIDTQRDTPRIFNQGVVLMLKQCVSLQG